MLRNNQSNSTQSTSQLNPVFLILQILATQSIYYLAISMFYLIFDRIIGLKPDIAQIFHEDTYDLGSKYGAASYLAHLFTMLVHIAIIAVVVGKANKCMDFVLTNLFIHFILCILYHGIPFSFLWYISEGIFTTVTIFASEFVCLKLETAEIKLSINDMLESKVKNKKDDNLRMKDISFKV